MARSERRSSTEWIGGVSPAAELGEQAGRGLVDAEEVQRHPARRHPCVRGLTEPVLTPAVLDHHHAQTIVSEHPIKPAVAQIQGCEQRRPRHTATVQLVQHLQGERHDAAQRGKRIAPPSHGRVSPSSPSPYQAVASTSFCAASDEQRSRSMLPRARRTPFSTAGGERISSGMENPGFPLRATAVAEFDEGSDGTQAADVPGACGLSAAGVSRVGACACGGRTARLAVRLLPLLTTQDRHAGTLQRGGQRLGNARTEPGILRVAADVGEGDDSDAAVLFCPCLLRRRRDHHVETHRGQPLAFRLVAVGRDLERQMIQGRLRPLMPIEQIQREQVSPDIEQGEHLRMAAPCEGRVRRPDRREDDRRRVILVGLGRAPRLRSDRRSEYRHPA